MNFEKLASDIASVVLQKMARISARNSRDAKKVMNATASGIDAARRGDVGPAFGFKGDANKASMKIIQRSQGRNVPADRYAESLGQVNKYNQNLDDAINNIRIRKSPSLSPRSTKPSDIEHDYSKYENISDIPMFGLAYPPAEPSFKEKIIGKIKGFFGK